MLASKGGVQNCSILCDRAGVGLAGARERRDEGRIAAKGLRCRRERGRDAWCSGVDELLLGHHVSLRPYGFASHFAPSQFNKFGPPSQEASPRARKCVGASGTGSRSLQRNAICIVSGVSRCGDRWGWLGATRRHADRPGNARACCDKVAKKAASRGRTQRRVLPPIPPFTGLGDPCASGAAAVTVLLVQTCQSTHKRLEPAPAVLNFCNGAVRESVAHVGFLNMRCLSQQSRSEAAAHATSQHGEPTYVARQYHDKPQELFSRKYCTVGTTMKITL